MWQLVLWTIRLWTVVFVLNGCMTAQNHAPDELASVEELGVEDPDPNEPAGPEFCNPRGKEGEDLRKCFEHNDAIYRGFEDEAKQREPWFNFTRDSWVQSPEIDSKFVVPVVQEDEAVKRLEKQALIELSPAEAEHLTSKPAPTGNVKPYLVRALLYYRENGIFAVFRKGDSILVRHDSRGASQPSETRSALVVYLDFKPKEIYVDCGVDG